MLTARAGFRLRVAEILVACILVAGYLWFSAGELLADFGGDNAVYWLTANHYSPFGPSHPLAAEYAATSKYPPLYPLVLALLGGGTSVLAAHLVSAALLCLGFLALHRYARAAGASRPAALALVLLVAALPVMRFWATDLESEALFLPVTLATLALALRGGGGARLLALQAALLAAAILTRTAGAVLVLAFALATLAERRPRRLAVLLAPLAAWLWNSVHQHSAGRYLHEMAEVYGHGGFEERLVAQLYALPVEWARALAGAVTTWPPIVFLSLFGIALAAAAIVRARRGTIDGYYAVASLALIALWPYPSEMQRLFGTIAPVLLVQGFVEGRRVSGRRGLPASIALAAVVLPAAAFALPDALGFVARIALPVAPALRPYTRATVWHLYPPDAALVAVGNNAAMYAALADVARLVPPGECVYATKPAFVALYGARRALQTPPDMAGPAFRAAARAGGCRYFLLTPLTRREAPQPFHPLVILGTELVLLNRHPTAFVANPSLGASLARWDPPR